MQALENLTPERDIAVLKLGSSTLLNEDGVGLDYEAVEVCADQIEIVNEEFHPLIVHGAAVGTGKGFLRDSGEPYEHTDMQVLASYGTPEVSIALRNALRDRGIKSGQVLANHNQMKAGSVLMKAMLFGIRHDKNAYHINENDQENLYGLRLLKKEEQTHVAREKAPGIDNDPMAARLTIAFIEELKRQGLSAELAVHLAIFTKIGGFVMDGEVQPEISASNRDDIYDQCDGVGPGGSGGMRVKAEACFDAYDAGAKTVHIASPDQSWLNVIKDKGEAGKVTKVVK
ncbi:MAG TPA: hypothetical protein VMU97_02435 [Candidatus Dormibacteraeota bacterium]|nr:hypothetical protein [Candidatus Dormibacteraeota bacterium]